MLSTVPEQPSLVGPLARIGRADELRTELEAPCTAFLQTSPYDRRIPAR